MKDNHYNEYNNELLLNILVFDVQEIHLKSENNDFSITETTALLSARNIVTTWRSRHSKAALFHRD